ncbi:MULTISPECIES: TauD/TfdA family dioxygenase [unclassified Minwuia]|jgi:alpha-ketoglutarate-dependent taurine dioxygenase|uniref:TauD/TfdA dioxygenase family protein n=1 Tax=unclassified Minwuia TaxID=2618799 RepID=UPI002479DEF5|nr:MULTISPECIES: TauD/TfdA family dioxygenase [unclassified Minwuia]
MNDMSTGYAILDVRRTSPNIGAEVRGVDLANGLTAEEFAEVERAFHEYQVLFFKDQSRIDPGVQVEIGKMFGPLHFHPAAPHLEGYPPVFVIHAHKDSKIANGEGWHTDVSCDTEPPLGTMLQMHILPSAGGDTMFASMYGAYDTLSPAMQSFLEGLTATHESEHIYRGRYSDRGVDDSDKVYPSAVHPVVRTHPATGRKALYVNGGFTTRINELSKAESRNLLDFLFRHMEEQLMVTRFHWSENDVALWDNRCVQHRALWDYWPEERKGHRVTIKGDRPFFKP